MKDSSPEPLSLRATQEWLAAQITAPRPLPPRACDWLLVPPPAGDVAERLGVYRDGYPVRVGDALAETFPAVAHLIGAAALRALVGRYSRSLRRHSFNLNDVGAELPAFLRDDPLAAELPFLPDLAELEWRITRAFHARAEAPLAAAALETLAPDDLATAVLRFAGSIALVSSPWPIRTLWQARETPIAEIDLDLRDRPEIVLVHRSGFDVECSPLEPLEAECLAALAAGARLGEVAADLAERVPETAFARWFGRWTALGIVTGVETSPRPRRAPPGGPDA